jgi:hypothetical protein
VSEFIGECSKADKEQDILEQEEQEEEKQEQARRQKDSTVASVTWPAVQAQVTLQNELTRRPRSGRILHVLATFAGLLGLERALKAVHILHVLGFIE